MPDFAALGPVINADTLDFRALGYTYDSIAIVGLGLDRTGSMLAMTPDPMISSDPDVTKWAAATRGVSTFLQDCETVHESGVTYVVAGVKTFRRMGIANDFVNVLPAPGYGLVKAGGTHSQAAFDGAVAGMSPGGSTPLADALADVHSTLVAAPFGNLPADERRYLAMLTDGIRTSGALMSSIPDGSFADTVVFGMGFGTGADVDYATIASMAAKGAVTLATTISYRSRGIGAMVMPVLGELPVPVQAGPPRGARYSRLLLAPKARVAVRNVHTKAAHALDDRPAGTQRDDQPACHVLVNIYARTLLRLALLPKATVTRRGTAIELAVQG
ncbi:hypothetical protein LuPra_00954 [Luteitalea pratensis]|uniref:Uncharacterized protein n=1 Tax=Luteitalea pratensis TaxID=1855912 RepID=A0A143PHP5_LUTPR|nr:hypothetical protein [Luteitalea pratensis]AMY07773.1 hypothetical protein LuPra_00954 [Luteitalea pratensis]